ncbi:hypothetical protein ALQ31_02732 [Pseudomonas amygdali pv. morsprunorum]|nr:hypothetical protein ALQ45_03440 [Pseudomonas amygdali pv. morsprunorum]RMO99227.1 hypothetical protein ALQ31_02732 [Pseudomonas amygdali pv. morsprunorum]RMU35807.1 hypothetical protein ALP31_01552 [Pseudomonas amygdali pv. morsprunorum]
MSSMQDLLRKQWFELRERMMGQVDSHSSISLRLLGEQGMWLGKLDDLAPQAVALSDSAEDERQTHAAIYRVRADVGAILIGGGAFAKSLVDFGGVLPILFDEQARHIGHMGSPASADRPLACALTRGGNAAVIDGIPVVMGTTGPRMVLNAELFEKCAKAYTLAKACGTHLTLLLWWVVLVANGRLMKDEKRAAQCFAEGKIPPETRGY